MSSFTKRMWGITGMIFAAAFLAVVLTGCGSIPTTIQFGDNSRVVQKTVFANSTNIKATRRASSKKSAPKSIAKLIEEGNHGK